jgi:hypothetical protein
MNTSVNTKITRVSTIRYVIFPRRRLSATLEISVRVDVVSRRLFTPARVLTVALAAIDHPP